MVLILLFERIAAGLEVNREDVMKMGRGGILTEPSRRPERRTVGRTQTSAGAKKIAAIVLAAGQSQRMGEQNKLLLKIEDQSVIQEVVNNLAQSEVDQIFVVTGHEEDRVRNELKDRQVTFIHNPEFAEWPQYIAAYGVVRFTSQFCGCACVSGRYAIRQKRSNRCTDQFL